MDMDMRVLNKPPVPLARLCGSLPSIGGEGCSFSGSLLSLAGDSFQYLVGLAVMSLANMVLLPLYTRYLSTAEFGLYALVEIAILGSIAVAGLGSSASYLKWFANSDPRSVSKLIGTTLWLNGLAAILIGTALSLGVDSRAGTGILGGQVKTFAFLLLPLVFLETEQNALLNHLRGCRRPAAFSIASTVRLGAVAALSVWLIAFRHEGLIGLFLGRVLGDVCGLLTMAFYSVPHLSLSLSWGLGIRMVQYGLPVVGGTLATMGLDASGRYFVNHYSTLEQVGLFAVGIKVAGLMRALIVAPFGVAWGGLIFQIQKEPRARFIYSKLLGYILLVGVAVAAILSLMSSFVLNVFATPAYAQSLTVIPSLLLVQALVLVQYPASVGIYIGSATRWLVPIYAGGLVLDMGLNRLLVPRYGISGAALSWLMGWLMISSVMFVVGQRYYRLHFEWKPVLIAAGVWVFAMSVHQFGWFPEGWFVLLRGFGCFVVILVVGYYLLLDLRKSSNDTEVFQLQEEHN